MHVNYERAIESVRQEINSWKYRFLTIYGKVTVIKTMCIPKLNHIAVVVPNPSCTHLRMLECELKQFITRNNPSIVDENTRKMSVKEGGFSVPVVNTFWKAIRMSWLRRSIGSEATWAKIHQQEVSPHFFDPFKSNFEALSKAKAKCRNPFWKEVYTSLIDCRLNVLLDHPEEYRYIPIGGEPQITSNGISIKQEWAVNKFLDSIIDCNDNQKDIKDINSSKKPFEYEYNELRVSLRDFLDIYLGSRLVANRSEVANNHLVGRAYNIYGRIVTKRKKGSSYFYSLLNTHAK